MTYIGERRSASTPFLVETFCPLLDAGHSRHRIMPHVGFSFDSTHPRASFGLNFCPGALSARPGLFFFSGSPCREIVIHSLAGVARWNELSESPAEKAPTRRSSFSCAFLDFLRVGTNNFTCSYFPTR
jgi:hypothetical protein